MGLFKKMEQNNNFSFFDKTSFSQISVVPQAFKELEMILEKNGAIRFFYNLQLFIKKNFSGIFKQTILPKKGHFLRTTCNKRVVAPPILSLKDGR